MFGFLEKIMPRTKSTETQKRVSKPRATGVRKLKVQHQSKESEPKPKKAIVFEKRKVLKILEKGHTKTHFHCQMEGGVTMHVPKSLFR